jgi:hypothetical protein
MVILQIVGACVGWFILSCIVMSFVEHQVHSRLMHKTNYLSARTATFKRIFEAHAIVHHKHYLKIFTDEPVPPGQDKEIRMNVHHGWIKGLPVAALFALVWWPAALIFLATVTLHHWVWNKIHLEMHKPEHRGFSYWPAYKFLARHHCLHHKYPDKNFNVVFPCADYFLGTIVRATPADRLWVEGMLLPAASSTQKEYANVK